MAHSGILGSLKMPFSQEYIDKVNWLLKQPRYIIKSDYLHEYVERIPFNFGTIAYQTVKDERRATYFTEDEVEYVMSLHSRGWIKVKI